MSTVRLAKPNRQPSHVHLLETKAEKFPRKPHPLDSKFIQRCKEAANSCGYALTYHGTMQRDIDLVAVAWTDDADDLLKFLGSFIAQTGSYIHSIERKPHGRISLMLRGAYGQDRDVDLSVVPPHLPQDDKP